MPVNEAHTSYLARRLTKAGTSSSERRIDEGELLKSPGNKVLLGEPGMGKSELMRELGRRIDTKTVTAIRFVSSKSPAKLVTEGLPLLIDGLDEAMSRREGDAIDAIVAQLEDAGSPPFILSCRSREWQEARSIAILRQLYGTDPSIVTLEPLDRNEADTFLCARHPSVDAEHVLNHLNANDLDDLYRNPLTLGLMGRVAETDSYLPTTRAALFGRVCELIWPEHDAERQDLGLAQLTAPAALDGAGAIAAALIFAGAEAASTVGAAHVQDADLRLAELETLPQAQAARVIFCSKLFQSIGPTRAKLIHRVVAEYLGARWLARQAPTPRSRRRLLAQFHGSGAVPASLRGMHAWLAYFGPEMADQVISADPYGVLRYGETAALPHHLADHLLEALRLLAGNDPYFRAADWDSRTAAGLMTPALAPKIDAIISSSASSEHLRSLLIEGLKGSALALDLSGTLEAVVLSGERFYRERYDAAEALLPHRSRGWWRGCIAALTDQAGEDGPRLGRHLIEELEADVPDDLLVRTLLSEMGMISCAVPQANKRRGRTARYYGRLLKAVPTPRLVGLLELFAGYAEMLGSSDWQNAGDIAEITTRLLLRALDEDMVDPSHTAAIWGWLGIIERAHHKSSELQQELARTLAANIALRRSIQAFVLRSRAPGASLWMAEYELEQRRVGMAGNPGDLACAFQRLADGNSKDPHLRQDWMDLARIAWTPNGLDGEVRAAADLFQQGDKALEAFLVKLANPTKPVWQVRQEKEAAKRERKRRVAFEEARRFYGQNRDGLRAGHLGPILQPAQVYFSGFSDLPSKLPPGERLAEWLGPAIRDDVLAGFEAVLHRHDLPSAAEIAAGLSKSTVYNFSYPLMAAIYERVRSGRGVADLGEPVQLAALLLSYDDHGWKIGEEEQAVRQALEAEVLLSSKDREAFARLWIEPALAAANSHIAGLYRLNHDPEWLATGAALAVGWLSSFPDVPQSVESGLVDCLTRGGALQALQAVATTRAGLVHRSFEHLLSWLAIDVLVRFEAVHADLKGICSRFPHFVWYLRDRLQNGRRGGMLPLTAAQAEWVISECRAQWPYAVLEGSGYGETNDYDATDFIRALISHVADDLSQEASQALGRLADGPLDTYSDLIRHMLAEQRQKRAEASFSALGPIALTALLNDGPPCSMEDLKALILEEMAVAQRKLLGDDLDSVTEFWTDGGMPRNENRCRDRLAAMIGPELARYGIQRITEADMPMTKRADLAFAHEAMQLPVEVKGQWHKDVWDAATGQLDLRYLRDWRSEQRGVYCVLWFGDLPSSTGRRLKGHPDGLAAPASVDAMRVMLIDRLPEGRRALIDVVVFDLRSGRS